MNVSAPNNTAVSYHEIETVRATQGQIHRTKAAGDYHSLPTQKNKRPLNQ